MSWGLRSVADALKDSHGGQDFTGLTRKLVELARPYCRLLVPVMVLQLTAAIVEALAASLMVPLLQVFVGDNPGTGFSIKGPIGEWSSWVLGGGAFETQLRRVAIAFLAVGLTRSAVHYASSIATNRFTMKVAADLRQRLLALYLSAEYQFFLDRRQGRMLNDLTEEPGRATTALTLFLDWGQQFLFAAGLALVLLSISWQATLVAGVVGMGMAVALDRLRLAAVVVGKEGMVNKRRLAALVAELLSGIRQIKLFGAEERVAQSHARLIRETVDLGLQNLKLLLLPGIVSRVTGALLIGGALFGITFLPSGGAKAFLPALGAFVLVSARLFPIVSDLSTQRLKLFSHSETLRFILSSLKQVPDEQTLRQRGGAPPFPGLRDRIEFEHVTFAYERSSAADTMPTRDSWVATWVESNPYEVTANDKSTPPLVLRDVTITFKRGQRTALVGPSGGGKSTVVDLLVRLFDPQEGRIMVDGVHIREYDVRSWRSHIGYVSQDTFIFHGAILENIAFSKPGATFEDVERAARIANAHEFILELPEGYDTVVGDRGMKLSGGQRQRIAIARAVLRDPPVLIFDEATSSLDTVAEKAVEAGIEGASRDRTVIVIAHRLSTVISADWIYVLDRGRVVESGSHEDLMLRQGVYRKLYASMFPVNDLQLQRQGSGSPEAESIAPHQS